LRTFSICLFILLASQIAFGWNYNSQEEFIDSTDMDKLKKEIRELGGYGGPWIFFSSVDGQPALFYGGCGGIVISHSWVIGGAGCRLMTDIEADNPVDSNFPSQAPPPNHRVKYLNMGYGGLFLEGIWDYQKKWHATTRILIGGGGINLRDEGDEVDTGKETGFFIIEPAVGIEFNLTEYFRMASGLAYRRLFVDELAQFNADNLSGFSFFMQFKIGRF